ncbi:MAG TPA: hypothetical protein PKJ95_01535 [Atribacterota bacterium]|nr:hypothetical protein [Atribacterota bacterium]
MCKTEVINETKQLIRDIRSLKEEMELFIKEQDKKIAEKKKQIIHNIDFMGKVEDNHKVLDLGRGKKITYPIPEINTLFLFTENIGVELIK